MKTASNLKGKRALVTGAARRLGREMCLELAHQGVDICVHYNLSRKEAEALCAELEALGVGAFCLAADLADANQAAGLVNEARKLAGPLDILVNNASVFPSDTLEDMTGENLFANLTVNAWSPFTIARAFAGQTDDGVIINMLDARIVENDRLHASYHVSKRMLATLTRMMALEFAPRVRVNAIAPGIILPPRGKDESYFDFRIKDIPLARQGEAGDVTRALVFLVESGFVTGEIIFVDGGYHMRGNTYGF